MNLILFDTDSWADLLPLTYTKPIAELRVGILTIKEKWEKRFNTKASYLTQDYLQTKFPANIHDDNLLINGSVLPSHAITAIISNLKKGEAIKKDGILIACRVSSESFDIKDPAILKAAMECKGEISSILFPWDIFALNGQEIKVDYDLLTTGRKSQWPSKTVQIINRENVFIEEGFKGEYFTLNASSGPIYLGKDSEIMEGSVIRGPFALCEHALVKLSAKIYGPTTIGPHCRAGGEINNSVLQAYSNKGHDGFLGNSVLGEWCNLGADTNNSNLKNNYADVKVWNYPKNRFIKTGLQFCGLIMGDHSKCGINTMFNTGTVVGVSANIFGSGFPRNFIPSFSWGGASGMMLYTEEKAFETMNLVLERRNIQLTETDKDIFRHIIELSAKYRK